MQFMWRKEINALQEDIVKGVLKGSLSILTERVDVAVEEFQRWRQVGNSVISSRERLELRYLVNKIPSNFRWLCACYKRGMQDVSG